MQTLKVKAGELPVHEVSMHDLQWYATECKSRPKREIAKAEIARRKGGGGQPAQSSPAQSSQALARQEASVMGAYVDPRKATAALEEASKHYHLVTPAPACGSLPEGCEVLLSMVRIDPNDPHLYAVGDKVAPDKAHLTSILNAAAGSIEYTRRLDNGSHPHYCRCEVGIMYRHFDGSIVRRSATAEMDVRAPDGPRYVEIIEKAKNATKWENGRKVPAPRDPAKQLLELRKFLLPQTESRALNRAIAAMGIRRSYTREELQKPFVVAGLMFTGRSDDPEARKQFRQAIADSFLGRSAMLYGNQSTAPAQQLHAPPPIGQTYDTEGDELPPDEPQPAAQPQVRPQTEPLAAAAPEPQQQGAIGDGYDDRGDDPDAY